MIFMKKRAKQKVRYIGHLIAIEMDSKSGKGANSMKKTISLSLLGRFPTPLRFSLPNRLLSIETAN